MEFSINGAPAKPPPWLAALNAQVDGVIRRINVGSHCPLNAAPLPGAAPHAHRDPRTADFGARCIPPAAWSGNGPTAEVIEETARLVVEQRAYRNRRDHDADHYVAAGRDRRWRQARDKLPEDCQPATSRTAVRQHAQRMLQEAIRNVAQTENEIAVFHQRDPELYLKLAEVKLNIAAACDRFMAPEPAADAGVTKCP